MRFVTIFLVILLLHVFPISAQYGNINQVPLYNEPRGIFNQNPFPLQTPWGFQGYPANQLPVNTLGYGNVINTPYGTNMPNMVNVPFSQQTPYGLYGNPSIGSQNAQTLQTVRQGRLSPWGGVTQMGSNTPIFAEERVRTNSPIVLRASSGRQSEDFWNSQETPSSTMPSTATGDFDVLAIDEDGTAWALTSADIDDTEGPFDVESAAGIGGVGGYGYGGLGFGNFGYGLKGLGGFGGIAGFGGFGGEKGGAAGGILPAIPIAIVGGGGKKGGGYGGFGGFGGFGYGGHGGHGGYGGGYGGKKGPPPPPIKGGHGGGGFGFIVPIQVPVQVPVVVPQKTQVAVPYAVPVAVQPQQQKKAQPQAVTLPPITIRSGKSSAVSGGNFGSLGGLYSSGILGSSGYEGFQSLSGLGEEQLYL